MAEEYTPVAKIVDEDGNEIEFEVMPFSGEEFNEGTIYQQEIDEIDKYLEKAEKKAQKLDRKSDLLTNHADGIDYSVAVASGVLTGLLDVFFVGELDLKECNEWGSDKVNEFIKKVAGEDGDGPEALERAIKKLENKSKPFFPSDPNLNDFGGGLQHHLRDFAHHPTLVGLLFSILTQFTKKCYGTDTLGNFIVKDVKDLTRIGETIPQKLTYATVYWFFHLVSDMAGTGEFIGEGTGLPGPLLSMAKELSVIPPFNMLKFQGEQGELLLSQVLSKIYNGTLFADHDENGKIIKDSVVKVDLRTELGVIKAQSWPVLINETIVRVFYSVRQLTKELKEHTVNSFKDVLNLDWRKILPFRNRTLTRMLTISSGTFMAVDMGDAAIRAYKNAAPAAAGGPVVTSVAFVTTFLLRVNYVGVGRFTIAVVSDVKMGKKKEETDRQRVLVYNELLTLTNAKLCYKQVIMLEDSERVFEKEADMWSEAKDASEAIDGLYRSMIFSMKYMSDSWKEILKSASNITKYFSKIEEKNPGLLEKLFGRKIDKLKE